MEGLINLGDEEQFVWSFESPTDVFDYLVDLNDRFGIIEVESIKQAFLNQERHFYYMEVVRFQETYLT